MKQQVFVIHGGNVYDNYDEYISSLKSYEVDLEKLIRKDWKASLQENLGNDFTVYLLKMPNGQNARYSEWTIWFEKYIPFFNDNVILIGHSLGAVFLAKYLSEVSVPKKIRATFMVAAPFDEDEGRKLPEFAITSPLGKLEEQAGELYMYHSKDDPVVEYSEFEKYRAQLPNAHMKTFEDRMHFNQEEFPEIVEDIKQLEARG